MTKLIAIILPDRVFISESPSGQWGYADLSAAFLFNGQKARPTNKSGWFELAQLPKKVEKITKPSSKITGYKLKSGFAASEKMPAFVDVAFFAYDDEEEDEHNNKEIMGLYESILSEEPEKREEVTFEIVSIAHKGSDWKFIPAPKGVQHFLIDEITKHPDLLQDETCSLTVEEGYERVRNHIKLNIDPRVAYVDSDYSFHFSVSKRIELHEKEKYQKNIKPFANKPKYVDDYRTHRTIKVLEIVPDTKGLTSYKGSSLAPKFEGANYQDLENNVSSYLQDLITKINEPLKDCPHCKGKGVIT